MFRVQSGGRLIRRPKQAETVKDESPQPDPVLPAAAAPSPSLPPRLQRSQWEPTHEGILTLTPEEARERFRRGDVPLALVVSGSLNLSGNVWLRTLPDWLRCTALIVDDCPNLSVLPSDLHAEKLSARRCPQIRELDGRLSVRETVNLSGSGVRTIHADLHANRLQLAHCRDLHELRGMISVAHLDLRGCANLSTLPASLNVTQTIDVAGSGLRALPGHIRAGLRWNNVPIDPRVAFNPQSLSGQEVMQVRNVQRRRVLLERIGIEKFLADVGGMVLDRDRDAGGERTLIRVPFDDDEDLVAVLVKCPSTGGSYALRVPPQTRTCREAVAWTAGLNIAEYHPVQEA